MDTNRLSGKPLSENQSLKQQVLDDSKNLYEVYGGISKVSFAGRYDNECSCSLFARSNEGSDDLEYLSAHEDSLRELMEYFKA